MCNSYYIKCKQGCFEMTCSSACILGFLHYATHALATSESLENIAWERWSYGLLDQWAYNGAS
jgi:hypothetical protein